jgi:hypothetical protein
MIDILEKKHAILVAEFDRYVMEHDEFAAEIPHKWSRQLAESQREVNQIVVYVTVKGLKPAKSRLVKPVLNRAAA